MISSYIIIYSFAGQDTLGQISITFDAWTSDASDPYLAVTSHYIHLEADQPNKWEL
jgi:hypothetical protein